MDSTSLGKVESGEIGAEIGTCGCCLTSLLPYDPATKKNFELKGGLQAYRLLLCAFLEAIRQLHAGNLEKFDALVGETACHIRAIKIAVMHISKHKNFITLEQNLPNMLAKIDTLLSASVLKPLMKSRIDLRELLSRENLLIDVSEDEIFLVMSFLLRETKVTNLNDETFNSLLVTERTAYKKITNFGDVSMNFGELLVKTLKIKLSQASVAFIKNIAAESNDDFLIKMTSEPFTRRHCDMHCLPLFWCIKAIFFLIHTYAIPVIVYIKFVQKSSESVFTVVDEDYLLYTPFTDKNGNFSLAESNFLAAAESSTAITFQGVVPIEYGEHFSKEEWRKTIRSFSMLKVILANAAAHPQYPDPGFDEQIDAVNDAEYNECKIYAEKNGFCLANSKMFFISHVFAKTLGRESGTLQ